MRGAPLETKVSADGNQGRRRLRVSSKTFDPAALGNLNRESKRQPASRRDRVQPGMPESVAIVHDWLTSMRGGERVVEALCKVFPHADVFTLTWDPSRLSPALAQRRATTSL